VGGEWVEIDGAFGGPVLRVDIDLGVEAEDIEVGDQSGDRPVAVVVHC
jgi:hypothetical protein